MSIRVSLHTSTPAALLLFSMVTAIAQTLKCCCVTASPVFFVLATVQNVPHSLHTRRLLVNSSARHGSSLWCSKVTPCCVAAGQMHEHTWPAVAPGQQCSRRYRLEAGGAPAVFRPLSSSLQENWLNFLSPDFILLNHLNRRQYRQRTERHSRSEQIEQLMYLRATEAFTDTTLAKGLSDRNDTFQVNTGREVWQEKNQQEMLRVLQSEHLLQPPKEPLFGLTQASLPKHQRSLKPQRDHVLQLQEQQTLFRRRSRRGFVKEDARWRRRILALRRNAMRRRTSREIFAECIEKQMKFAAEGSRQLREAREKEEFRRLRLVDPLVRPVERRRSTVQWWPNFAREALPRLLTALRHADVLIEVRDARLPWLTQLPLHISGNAIMKPRVVVLTHADAAAEQLQELCGDAPGFLHSFSSPCDCPRDSVVSTPASTSLGKGKPGGADSIFSREQLELCHLPQQHLSHRQQAYLQQQHHSSPQAHERPREHQQVLGNQEMQLTPPAPPATPVIFINAKQDGAGVVRLEKAIRRIWRRWREFNRNAEVFRRQVRIQKQLFARTNKKNEDLKLLTSANTALGSDSPAPVESADVSPASSPFMQIQCRRASFIVGTDDTAEATSAATVFAAGDAEKSPSPTGGSPCPSPPSPPPPAKRSACSGGTDATPEHSGSSEEQRRKEKETAESMLKDRQRRPAELRGGLRARRPLHLLLVGMPNVGKSALCNRLLHAKKARSYNYPGVSKVVTLAEVKHHCCTGAASQRVLTDLQKGYLGRLTLEIPPTREQLTTAFASLRKQQLKKRGRSSVTRAPRETHKRVQPAIPSPRKQLIGGENLNVPANTYQSSQLLDERLLPGRKAHRHDATGHGGENWDIVSSTDSSSIHTRAETDGNILETDTTPGHAGETSGRRFRTEGESFVSSIAYGAVCAIAEEGDRGCESKAISASATLSNCQPPNVCVAEGPTSILPRENCLERKKALQPLDTLVGESPETSGNTVAHLLCRRDPFLTDTKIRRIAQYAQIGSRTSVLQAGREMPLGAGSMERLQPQPNQKSNKVGVEDDSGPGMHYRCNEVHTNGGQASAQTNSVHIFVWRTPLSKTNINAMTGGGDVSLVAQKLGPVTTNEDVMKCTCGTSAKLESWEMGAFEGW